MIYNTITGITSYLTSLDGFNRLIIDRRRAVKNEELLDEFIILGHWTIDKFGQCIKIGSSETPDGYRRPGVQELINISNPGETVISKQGFYDEWPGVILTTHFESQIPKSSLICPVCGLGWNIKNCYDTQTLEKSIDYQLSKQIGKSLYDFLNENLPQDELWIYRGEIRNDALIDNAPHPSVIGAKVNEHGWYRPAVESCHMIQDGDYAAFAVQTFFHKQCYSARISQQIRKSYVEMLEKSGWGDSELIAIPNEYSTYEKFEPWFLVKHPLGTLKIGWRKRVLQIDWSGTGIPIFDEFRDEKTTHNTTFIHAHNLEKAADYLKIIKFKIQQATALR
jgi:hypothetical protein